MNIRLLPRSLRLGSLPGFWRAWLLGWLVVGKSILVAIILGGSYKLLELLTRWEDFFLPDTAWGITTRLVCSLLILGFYLPLAFYVAASWVGFCPRVDHDALPAPNNSLQRTGIGGGAVSDLDT